ncbi:MAG: zinc ribbon domain-containing protein [Methanomicrobiales archaeon]
MSLDETNDIITSFNVICPECGVGNPENAKFCLFCEKNLEEVILFLEDDSFDIELTKDAILEYRKKFWGSERTGKINKYYLDKIENIEYGRPVSRLIFNYQDKRIVIPLKKENLEELKLELNKLV